MKNKNIKGIIGLVSGLLSIACCAVAILMPTNEVRDTGIMLPGSLNIWLCVGAIVTAILAIVFGALGKKKTLPYRGTGIAGLILGLVFLIVSLCVTTGVVSFAMFADYANYGDDSLLGQSIQNNPDSKAQFDKMLDQILNSAK